MNADIRQMKTAAELGLAQAFETARQRLPGGDGISARRSAAFRTFEDKGLPHRRVEEWKYTDLRALMRDAKPLAPIPDAQALERAERGGGLLPAAEARRLTFVNGVFVPKLSDLAALEPGLSIVPLAKALADGDRLVVERLGTAVPTDDVAVALNTAFMGDGAVIRVARDSAIARPIHLAFVFAADSPAAVFARSLVVVESGAQLALIESHNGPDGVDYQVNAALEILAGDHARVNHVKIGSEGSRALHVSTLMAAIGAASELTDTTFTTGGAVVRNQVFLRFAGEGATATIRGAALIKGRQHVDTTLVVDHALPGGTSRELYKAVLDGESHSVFQGKIIVRPDAQKTDGRMMTQALLLSETAEADNKPELEIFADDVQCGHGATAGALNGDLLFYLMARGIAKAEAEALLIEAFVGEAVEGIEPEGLKDVLMAAAAQWLAARGRAENRRT
jgi:Fe-S cluster assembly protein SufD